MKSFIKPNKYTSVVEYKIKSKKTFHVRQRCVQNLNKSKRGRAGFATNSQKPLDHIITPVGRCVQISVKLLFEYTLLADFLFMFYSNMSN